MSLNSHDPKPTLIPHAKIFIKIKRAAEVCESKEVGLWHAHCGFWRPVLARVCKKRQRQIDLYLVNARGRIIQLVPVSENDPYKFSSSEKYTTLGWCFYGLLLVYFFLFSVYHCRYGKMTFSLITALLCNWCTECYSSRRQRLM